jgi:hypothetical protein
MHTHRQTYEETGTLSAGQDFCVLCASVQDPLQLKLRELCIIHEMAGQRVQEGVVRWRQLNRSCIGIKSMKYQKDQDEKSGWKTQHVHDV